MSKDNGRGGTPLDEAIRGARALSAALRSTGQRVADLDWDPSGEASVALRRLTDGEAEYAVVRRIAREAPVWLKLSGQSGQVVAELLKAGVRTDDLPDALAAVADIERSIGWTFMHATRFVATASAIGGLHGPSIRLASHLARVAAQA